MENRGSLGQPRAGGTAASTCHAEGRGFESHHPLLTSPLETAGFLRSDAQPANIRWFAWQRNGNGRERGGSAAEGSGSTIEG
jgi:hypothetical protein